MLGRGEHGGRVLYPVSRELGKCSLWEGFPPAAVEEEEVDR